MSKRDGGEIENVEEKIIIITSQHVWNITGNLVVSVP